VAPPTVACALCVGPGAVPSTHCVRATPAASVVVGVATLPPPPVTAQATCTPGTGLPAASRTITANESSTTAPTTPATRVSPLVALGPYGAACVGAPAVAVAVKVADASTCPVPLTARASSVCGEPATPPSVHSACANPDGSVVAVPAETCPPPAVTTKLTVCPSSTFPPASVTFTTNGWASWAFTTPVCAFPETTSTCAAGPVLEPVESHPVSATVQARARRASRFEPLSIDTGRVEWETITRGGMRRAGAPIRIIRRPAPANPRQPRVRPGRVDRERGIRPVCVPPRDTVGQRADPAGGVSNRPRCAIPCHIDAG
jgi:hypothetical protein